MDNLLPAGIPGYGTLFDVVGDHRPVRAEGNGFLLGNLLMAPELNLTEGYDSAPNGSAGSSVFTLAPSLLASDPILGFGAFAGVNFANDPQDNTQSTQGGTLAFGERAVLPGETITLAAAFIEAQETGFALNDIATTKPVRYAVQDFRAGDAISAGMFTVKPEIALARYGFPILPGQNRSDLQAGLTTRYQPGGPVDLLLRLHFTQSDDRDAALNADTTQVLAGAVDTQDGLWTLSALAGAAQRRPARGKAIIAPVLEAGVDWMPSRHDRLRLTLAQEIDDPDEVSATPYRLSEMKFSWARDCAGHVSLHGSAQFSHAAFYESAARESLFSADAGAALQLADCCAVNAEYRFNDRQANELRAANEHVVTLGLAWKP
jgi:hypothetical protein